MRINEIVNAFYMIFLCILWNMQNLDGKVYVISFRTRFDASSMCCQLLGLKIWFYFLRYEGLLLEKGILEQKGYLEKGIMLYRFSQDTETVRLFYAGGILDVLDFPTTWKSLLGNHLLHLVRAETISFGHSAAWNLDTQVDWRSCHMKKIFSSCTPISLIHIHFLEFILNPSYAWENQLRLSFLRSRIQK